MSNEKKELEKITRELIVMAAENSAAATENVNAVKDVDLSYDKKGEPTLDIYIICSYGGVIPDIAWNVQNAVKNSVQNAANVKISKINIHVQGVSSDTKGN